jgi:hypothetical protein
MVILVIKTDDGKKIFKDDDEMAKIFKLKINRLFSKIRNDTNTNTSIKPYKNERHNERSNNDYNTDTSRWGAEIPYNDEHRFNIDQQSYSSKQRNFRRR